MLHWQRKQSSPAHRAVPAVPSCNRMHFELLTPVPMLLYITTRAYIYYFVGQITVLGDKNTHTLVICCLWPAGCLFQFIFGILKKVFNTPLSTLMHSNARPASFGVAVIHCSRMIQFLLAYEGKLSKGITTHCLHSGCGWCPAGHIFLHG